MNLANRRLALGVILGILLSACGGTAGSPAPATGVTGATGPSGTTGPGGATGATGPTGGGTGGTSFAVTALSRGAITSLAPLTVNGVRFDTREAEIRVEGRQGTEAELRKGQVVRIRGAISGADGRAATVSFDDDLRGKVDDRGAGRMHVGGHEVQVDDATEFEDETRREDSIQPGERVRVSGHRLASGALRATRVEKDAGTQEDFEVKGFVTALDASATPPAFSLRMTPDGAVAYRVTLATGVSLPAGIADGAFVEVRSATRPDAGALTATAVELEDAVRGAEHDEAEVEGIVTSGTSAAFSIGDRQVTTSAATLWENGVPDDLVPGVRVEAEGTLDGAGVLAARKVSFRSNVRIQGSPSAVANAGDGTGSFQVLGITVRVDALTEWSSSGGSTLSLASLGTGPVRVRGQLARDGKSVVATRIDGTGDDRPILQGPVSSRDAAARTLVVLGVTIQATDRTELSGTTLAAFLDAVVPGTTVVKARGKDAAAFADGTLVADQLEIESAR